MKVISAIGLVAPKARIIFMDVDFGDGYGYTDLQDETLVWQWILDNADKYNIRAVTMSWSIFTSNVKQPVINILNSLYHKGIFMVSSLGNTGTQDGWHFPQNHQYVYAIGSVDHERRIGSLTGFYSGYAVQTSCASAKYYGSFCSLYGRDSEGASDSLDFAMPGNGVPVADSVILGKLVYNYAMAQALALLFLRRPC